MLESSTWLIHLLCCIGAIAPILTYGVGSCFTTLRVKTQDKQLLWLHTFVERGNALSIASALGALAYATQVPRSATTMASIVSGPAGDYVAITLLVDRIAALLLVLISTIGFVVTAYSRRYLEGEPRHRYFLKWLAITVSIAQLLPIAGNLALLLVLWFAISVSLHKLLLFYPDRPQAQSCARQKFLISRLGDAALLAATLLIAWNFGTLDFKTLWSLAEKPGAYNHSSQLMLTLAGLLVVLGAASKSAQVPFHAWLPQSLETPTPVSALMHAGIINAGGLLLIRLSPCLSWTTTAPTVLLLIGGVTAVYGMAVMVTQTSIKKRLAYSTVGQMGFMMIQCGLGLYALAFFHIIAHGFYKAYAFLRSGSAMEQAREQLFFPNRYAHSPGNAAIFLSLLLLAGVWLINRFPVESVPPYQAPILLAWSLALAHLTWGTISVRERPLLSLTVGIGFACLLLLSYWLFALGFTHFLTTELPTNPATPASWAIAAVCALLVLGFAIQIFGKSLAKTSWGTRLHIHLHNGLYFETLYSRFFEQTRSHKLPKAPFRIQPSP